MSLNCVAFNQDYSHLAIGTSNGFRVYTTEPFAKAHQTYDGNISLMEMLFSTSLVALVLSPRRLVITNTKRNSTICELTFPTTILAVKLNRKRLIVVLENQIYVYDISNMKLVHTVNTSPNPQGVCALSASSDRPYLVYPLPQSDTPASYTQPPSHVPPSAAPHQTSNSGHVLVFDPISLQAINVIEAHRAPLSCIATNRQGTRLATASDKGTIIRVFSIPDGQKLFQFRRGSMPSRIYSMSFNDDSTLLCVSSATDTIHVFKLASASEQYNKPAAERATPARRVSERSISPGGDAFADDINAGDGAAARRHNGTFAGMIRRTSQNVSKGFAATVGGYLPSAVTEMLEPTRDFAWFKVPRQSGATGVAVKSVVAMSPNGPQVMVVTSEGDFLVYNIDLEKGGEAELIKQQSILQSNERPGRSTIED